MKSKSLVIFLLLLITFSCFIDCYEETLEGLKKPKAKKGKGKGKKGKGGKSKEGKNSLKIKSPSNKLKTNKGDYQVCKLGKNLGLLSSGSSCSIKYSNYCKTTITRKADLPAMSKAKKALLAKKILKESKGSIKKLKKKKRWTLAGRTAKFKKPKLTKKQKKAKQKAIKKKQKRKSLLKEAKFFARKILQKRSEKKSKGKKGLKKEAKRLAKKVTQGNTKAVRIAFGLKKKSKPKKIKKISEKKKIKKDFSKGKFCVQSVVWNLSHCCFFTKRIEAQNFANTLPTPKIFRKRLEEGRRATDMDKIKVANKKIKVSSKDLKKVKKIVQKRKKMMKKGGGKKKGKKGKGKKK